VVGTLLHLLRFFTRPLSITRFLLMRSTALLCLCAILLGSGWMGDAMAGEGIEAARQGPAQGLRGLDPRVDTGRQPASVLPELVALPELRSAEAAQAPDADGVSETSAHIEQTDAPAVAEEIGEQTPFFSSSQDLLERCWSREELLGNSDEKRAHPFPRVGTRAPAAGTDRSGGVANVHGRVPPRKIKPVLHRKRQPARQRDRIDPLGGACRPACQVDRPDLRPLRAGQRGRRL
jgi:hypothetical protein